jgi:hypothetical protein
MTSKNKIVLRNATHGTHTFSVLDSHEIFDTELVGNLLEAIENKTYVFDDIVELDIVHMMKIKTIDVLPANLEKLKIKHTTLERITIPDTCRKLKELIIDESNIVTVPKIDFLTDLRVLEITNSNVSRLPDTFPKSLISINLSGNMLNETQFELTKFPKGVSVILFNNMYVNKPKLEGGYMICYGTQHQNKTPRNITNYTIQQNDAIEALRQAIDFRNANNAQHLIYNPRLDVHIVQIAPNLNNTTTTTNATPTMFNSSQTVHITSICNSVTQSIQHIISLTKITYQTHRKQDFIDSFIKYIVDKHVPKSNCLHSFVSLVKKESKPLRETIRTWCSDISTHTKTGITYGELFARIWLLVKDLPNRDDYLENIRIEINDSIGMCFTGRLNRLVNSLIGFIDGIVVGISIKEQLQLEINKILGELTSNKIDYDTCKKHITDLFENPDVKEDPEITDYYKNAWLDALEDYKPESKTDPIVENVIPLATNVVPIMEQV